MSDQLGQSGQLDQDYQLHPWDRSDLEHRLVQSLRLGQLPQSGRLGCQN